MRTLLPLLSVLAAHLFAPSLAAQRVETISTGAPLNGPDGAAVDRAGRVYIANWGRGDGTTVVRMDSAGTPQLFMDGFRAPDGLAFDRRGNLYVSNFGNYDGTTVSRITPDGSVRPFSTGFNAPLGLAFGPDGDMYVSNFGSGLIHRVARDGTPRVHATIPNETPARLQYLAFDPCGTLYVPSYGHNVVYAVGQQGDVRVFAGSGRKGAADGAAREAEFDGPNSIVRTAGGDLIVTEFNANRARRIRMDPAGPASRGADGQGVGPCHSEEAASPPSARLQRLAATEESGRGSPDACARSRHPGSHPRSFSPRQAVEHGKGWRGASLRTTGRALVPRRI